MPRKYLMCTEDRESATLIPENSPLVSKLLDRGEWEEFTFLDSAEADIHKMAGTAESQVLMDYDRHEAKVVYWGGEEINKFWDGDQTVDGRNWHNLLPWDCFMVLETWEQVEEDEIRLYHFKEEEQ